MYPYTTQLSGIVDHIRISCGFVYLQHSLKIQNCLTLLINFAGLKALCRKLSYRKKVTLTCAT